MPGCIKFQRTHGGSWVFLQRSERLSMGGQAAAVACKPLRAPRCDEKIPHLYRSPASPPLLPAAASPCVPASAESSGPATGMTIQALIRQWEKDLPEKGAVSMAGEWPPSATPPRRRRRLCPARRQRKFCSAPNPAKEMAMRGGAGSPP